MIVISGDDARRFRALARKCSPRGARGPAPPALCRRAGGTVTLSAATGGGALSLELPARPGGEGDECFTVPMAVLAEVEGAGRGPVELEAKPGGVGEARWRERSGQRALGFDPAPATPSPPPPGEWAPAPARLLAALHECALTAARSGGAGRYALDRVQVRGAAGTVCGTDAQVALVASGFAFPFARDLLVPALPVFGCRELAAQADIQIGLAGEYLAVRAGPWTVWLRADGAGRYPDIDAVTPRPPGGTSLELGAGEVATLLGALRGGVDADRVAVVAVDSGGAATICLGSGPGAAEVTLSRPSVGPAPASVAFGAAALARALALGCTSLRLHPGRRPVVFAGPSLTLVAVPADPPPAPAGAQLAQPGPAVPPPTPRSDPVKPPAVDDPPDPADALAEAEALRAALADAAHRAGRLVALLKSRRRERRVLATALAGLKSLDLNLVKE